MKIKKNIYIYFFFFWGGGSGGGGRPIRGLGGGGVARFAVGG